MTYKHFTIRMRYNLAFGLAQGLSIPDIAEELGLHPSSVRRELKRNTHPYDPEQAQARYEHSRERNEPLEPKLKESIEYHIRELKWSPEQYAGRYGWVSFKSIYRWIQSGKLGIKMTDLRRKGKKTKAEESRGKIKTGRSILERPDVINERLEMGHWECDTVVSPRGKDKACVATFVERVSRFYLSVKIPDRSSSSMLWACHWLKAQLPKTVFKSMTCDNGKEFAGFKQIEELLDCPVYFAEPYRSWQRGSNENANGLLREFFPKGTCFSTVPQATINHATALINARPRKVLGFKTNYEIFMESGVHFD
jgi:IS30 family transposase